LAVLPEFQGQGIGRQLVDACVVEARELGIKTVFTLTLEPTFFTKCGFRRVERDTLSIKVWQECYRCPKFSKCDEIAMIRTLQD
jgi:amino-acid N-acetyltransferase